MRILFWSEAFPPSIGGVEILAARLLDALRSRGHLFRIIAPADPKAQDESFHGIPIYRLPFEKILASRDIAQYARLIQTLRAIDSGFQPELVHIFHPGAGVFFHLQAASTSRAPDLVTLHQHLPDRQIQDDHIYGRLLNRVSWVTTCSRAVLGVTQKQMPELAGRSNAIQNALPFPSLEPTPLDFNSPQLLCAGRLVHQKGFDVALDAFAKVNGHYPHARLVIAGDGPMREQLQSHARKLNIANAVDFLGWVESERICSLINGAALVIVPSRAEPFGLVSLEAAQMARPVVATRVGGSPEVVVDGETGLLVEKEDPGALANAILSLLAHPERGRRLGETGRQRARKLFSWDRFVDAYSDLYTRLTAR